MYESLRCFLSHRPHFSCKVVIRSVVSLAVGLHTLFFNFQSACLYIINCNTRQWFYWTLCIKLHLRNGRWRSQDFAWGCPVLPSLLLLGLDLSFVPHYYFLFSHSQLEFCMAYLFYWFSWFSACTFNGMDSFVTA